MNRVRKRSSVLVCLQVSAGRLPWIFAVTALMLTTSACRRESGAPSFRASLRCGMTREEVARLARDTGYRSADKSWLERSVTNRSQTSKDLTLADLTFRRSRLVAFRESFYDRRTGKIQYRDVDLCEPQRQR